MKRTLLLLFLVLAGGLWSFAQGTMSLKECVGHALENNRTLQKSKLDQEKAIQARREIIGALLPQISGSGSMAYNFDKNTVVMPNFMNSMLPPAMQDPNADKYMTIPMGMNNTSSIGASLAQQLINFSLFNAVEIAKTSRSMADIGVEASTDDVISQTATLYYNIQAIEYGIGQFDRSISLMDSTMNVMQTNRSNGIIRDLDVDRIKVARTNLLSQKNDLIQAREVQKNLLKLSIGQDMDSEIAVLPMDTQFIENIAEGTQQAEFIPDSLPALRLMAERKNMSFLQLRSAKYEALPTLTFVANYSYNFMSDEFYTGSTFHKYPISMVSLSLKVPIFSGFSRSAKVKQAQIELDKTSKDQIQLEQSLRMADANARMGLESSRRTIEVQKDNMQLAENVYKVTDGSFKLGISSLSDVLNASSEMIKAQVNYVDALHKFVQAYIDLKKADGTIKEIINQ